MCIRDSDYMDELGYMARWEPSPSGHYLIHVANCPYERIARETQKSCTMDVSMLTHLLGVAPKRIAWSAQGDPQCTYAVSPAGD